MYQFNKGVYNIKIYSKGDVVNKSNILNQELVHELPKLASLNIFKESAFCAFLFYPDLSAYVAG